MEMDQLNVTLVLASFWNHKLKNEEISLDRNGNDVIIKSYLHDDEMDDKHFAFVVELGNVDPAEVVSPTSVVEGGHSAVIRPDVKPSSSRILFFFLN
jgi:hypothetical protein